MIFPRILPSFISWGLVTKLKQSVEKNAVPLAKFSAGVGLGYISTQMLLKPAQKENLKNTPENEISPKKSFR